MGFYRDVLRQRHRGNNVKVFKCWCLLFKVYSIASVSKVKYLTAL